MTRLNHYLKLAALLLIYSASATAADNLDRLFTTKSEREILNALRANQDSAKTAKSSIQGYVKRSDGVVTWWLDNQPMPQHPDTAEINAQKQ